MRPRQRVVGKIFIFISRDYSDGDPMQSMTSVVSMADSSSGSAASFDIERFVGEATWKDILVELVHKNQLNPWDIDIIDIVEKYISVVKGMKVMDMRVPANIVLAASILLRLKSEMLAFWQEDEAEAEQEPSMGRPFVAVDDLSVRLRLPPRRRVTLQELIGALDEAMKLKDYRIQKTLEVGRQFPLVLAHMDVEADIEALHALIKDNVDGSRMITFSSLYAVSKKEDALLDVFIPLLFLANKNRVTLVQESFFKEIIIAMN
ncbi:Segregation and condensation protein A [uncultured archaeon]|nr:Segregation and condensation protein A [uncultured archaeon]